MKYKNVLYTAVISTLCLGITSCSDFLDEMPDNRTELTTEERHYQSIGICIPNDHQLSYRRILQ